MSSECVAIEDENGQSFRRGVNRCRQSRRTGSHDCHVKEAIWIDRRHQADTTGKFDLAGIAQQPAIGTKDDRQLTRVDVKTLDQRLCLHIGLGVEPLGPMYDRAPAIVLQLIRLVR